jgi:prepilin-type processing-associated H-X9-DG protein
MLCEVWGRCFPDHTPLNPLPPGYPTSESSRGMNLHAAVYFDWPPNTAHFDPWHPNSFHPGGVNCLYADGSVHFVIDSIDLNVFKAMSTISGKEAITPP